MTHLTDAQQKFVDELVSTGCTPTEAARRTGFAAPGQEAYRLMRKDHVVAAIRDLRERTVSGHAANLAIKTLIDIMADTDAPAAARVSAARTVCEAAGDFDRAMRGAPRTPTADMTMDQLLVVVAQIDKKIEERAIDGSPLLQLAHIDELEGPFAGPPTKFSNLKR